MSEFIEAYCAVNCRKRTTWVRGKTRDRCQGCKTEFPCLKCKHMDCREARGEVAPDAQGILRPVSSPPTVEAAVPPTEPTPPASPLPRSE